MKIVNKEKNEVEAKHVRQKSELGRYSRTPL